MPNDIDKSLLDRLQALRGPSPNVTPERAAPIKFDIDVIERSKTPTREDALAARLKSLRAHDEASLSASTRGSPKVEKDATPSTSTSAQITGTPSRYEPKAIRDSSDDVDFMFQTDDQTLEELLGGEGENLVDEPSDEQVKALLEELSKSVPQDAATGEKRHDEDDDKEGDSDASDGEHMQREVDDVIARFRDEVELDATLGHGDQPENQQENQPPDADLALPSLPSNLDDLPSTSPPQRATSADIDDITARMAALRAPNDSFDLPSVPNSKPSAGKPISRLTSKTDYTDEDMDGWCTVCLEDATLQCPGCDDDVYCARCWREMHIGPSAGFDERSHKAVQFTKAKKKEKRKVALGA